MWHARDIIAVVELAFYIPAALLTSLVCFRHGFIHASGWLYTVLLCIVRIGGAICQFLLHINQTRGLIQATLVLDSIGLCPLLMATLGILGRCFENISNSTTSNRVLISKLFLLIQVVIVAGLILGIIGTTSPRLQPHNIIKFNSTAKASIILYIVGYAGIVIMYFVSFPQRALALRQERMIPMALLIALPFILVRLTYAGCAIFMHSHTFSVVRGHEAVYGGMAIIEEFVVITVFIVIGFAMEDVPDVSRGGLAKPREGKWWKEKRGKERKNSKDEFEMRSLSR